ncbi:transglycosylase domain-containing protein [Acidicapsa dinghuensis]|uniref:peptidoglycan glycosyltransferase n=1 Tax=Acidicapsa dinghuensis TaxID=2218256 RepID=A0ABW1EKF8_9BACT|nr:transglycosylase domain-containing protein [Acidicapsa dinghuensis]
MALKVKIERPATRRGWKPIVIRTTLAVIAAGTLVFFAVFGFYYFRYGSIVDERLKHPVFATTAKIYAAPREVRIGQKLNEPEIVNELRQAGYTPENDSKPSPLGTFGESSDSVAVHPGPQSYHAPDSATIRFSDGVVSALVDDKGQALSSYELEPLLITGLSEDTNRTKRRLLTFDEIPSNLVNAVLAIEDRRFFDHGGVNYFSIMSWGYHDLIGDRKHKGGASTLTMQLAKLLFLSDNGTIKYKLIQIMVAFHLEHHFDKKQIFEMYANQINLGQQGSFAIDGFGEAAQAYFGKDVKQLDLAQCAMLAGIIQRPNYFNPYRHAERTMERRNLVLDSMVETGAITKDQAEAAKAESLKVSPQSVDASDAPYFVDLVHEQLNQKLGDRDFNREGLHIYTSLDPDLQRAATWAVDNTMHVVDEQVDKLYARHHKNEKAEGGVPTYPQVALVALNPHTGQVLALVGGRSYGMSQLNHAVANRPTGSIFKPFVYASAFNTSIDGTMLPGHDELFSPITILNDEQTTYDVGTQEYTPHNDGDKYYGDVTARFALQMSLNNATIGLASLVGFDKVAALARSAGVKSVRATPAMAIGAYSATPMEMAGAYTIFANGGLHLDPWMVASVRTPSGDVIEDYSPTSKQLLDPRVAYLTTNLMQNVIASGTGNEVRRRGFMAPAAGKTGTSHDAWFAGYTSNLLCVVWVGNDDYTDIKIEGAHAAAPIWAEFMKKAIQLPQYSDTHDFNVPSGVQMVQVDKISNLPTDGTCSGETYTAAFLDGTVPTETCSHPNPPDKRNFLQKIFGLGDKKPGT